ncbi:MAG: hypothetical protein ABL963_17415 [Longimicrobiales bacterium]
MSTAEKVFWLVVLFLVVKGFIDAAEAKDREKVRKALEKYRRENPDDKTAPLFQIHG